MAAGWADGDNSVLRGAVCGAKYPSPACLPIERKRDLLRDEVRDRFDLK